MSAKWIHVFVVIGMAAGACASHGEGAVVVDPRGELRARVDLTQHRIAVAGEPPYTRDFILADLTLNPAHARRFVEYSGDLSGRVIEAMAVSPAKGDSIDLDGLVKDALACQREDGRFGNASLTFAPDEIGAEHMALLWGNGRILVELLTYYSVKPEPAVLDASRRLGEFLLGIQASCSNEAVVQRMRDSGAAGVICFTQLIEGFAMLGNTTGEKKYLDAAEQIIPWLGERGTQHSHGYLTTLRGMVMLAEATGKAEVLAKVEQAYAELVASPDNLVFGGVPEYFGGKGDRDEGCAEVDFVRLSLQLWHATGKADYIDRAERCMLNELFGNQFQTGDFGHRSLFQQGFKAQVDRAWWCCTMHGLRVFRDIVDSIVREEKGLLKVDLFLDAAFAGKTASGTIARLTEGGLGVSITMEKASSAEFGVAVRKPGWATGVAVKVNGRVVESTTEDGYVTVKRKWAPGDTLGVVFAAGLRLETRDKKTVALDTMGADVVEGALLYGPYVLSVQSSGDAAFFAEPWANNVVYVSHGMGAKPGKEEERPFAIPGTCFAVSYMHEGAAEPSSVTLRPISDCMQDDQNTIAVWLRFQRK